MDLKSGVLLILAALLPVSLCQDCPAPTDSTWMSAQNFSQELTSPGHPQPYPQEADCLWRVRAADQDQVVEVTVEEAIVDNADNADPCQHFLAFHEGESTEGTTLWRVCHEEAGTVRSEGPSMVIHFRSGPYGEGMGFRLFFRQMHPSEIEMPNHSTITYICAGAVVFIVIIATLVICHRRRQRRRRAMTASAEAKTTDNASAELLPHPPPQPPHPPSQWQGSGGQTSYPYPGGHPPAPGTQAYPTQPGYPQGYPRQPGPVPPPGYPAYPSGNVPQSGYNPQPGYPQGYPRQPGPPPQSGYPAYPSGNMPQSGYNPQASHPPQPGYGSHPGYTPNPPQGGDGNNQSAGTTPSGPPRAPPSYSEATSFPPAPSIPPSDPQASTPSGGEKVGEDLKI